MMFSQKVNSRNFQKSRLLGSLVLLGMLLWSVSLHAAPLFKDPSPEEMNAALGIPLFAQGNLWTEPADQVASRLGLREESKTSAESGYRLYPDATASVLGVRPFSLFLQGIGGVAARFSVIFSNKGDVGIYATQLDRQRANASADGKLLVTPQMRQAYQAAIRRDGDQLRKTLSALLGDAIPSKLGKVTGMDERGDRWDWRGTAFILSSPRNEYVALRILPVAQLDDLNAERKAFTACKELIPKRVLHRANGDVLITDLPMVNQGAKGYCVPATYERVLRYYGLSGDMNLLAMAGSTEAGGGTSVEKIASAAYGLVREAGGKITSGIAGAKISDIQPYIDKGEPVLWALYSSDELNDRLGERMAQRVGVVDGQSADVWSKSVLPQARSGARTLPKKGSHVCLIIGYNHLTREIAISDSWGLPFAERWITEEEAQVVSQGDSTVIGW